MEMDSPEGMPMESGQDEHEAMLDQCAMECMEAIESKDKAAFKDAFHVLISDVVNKMAMEMGEQES